MPNCICLLQIDDGILILEDFIEPILKDTDIYLFMLCLMQVGQFVNCLIEARSELQHKYVIQFLGSFLLLSSLH